MVPAALGFMTKILWKGKRQTQRSNLPNAWSIDEWHVLPRPGMKPFPSLGNKLIDIFAENLGASVE